MTLLLTMSVLLALTALFGVANERYPLLQPSIGLMLLALVNAKYVRCETQ